MLSCISEAENILQTEFGFKPNQSRIVYYNEDSLGQILKRRDKDIKGFFQPRALTAYVSENPQSTLLTRVIHEYLGHGSYCEYTSNGKRIVQFEQEMKGLEGELFGGDLGDNSNIALRNSKENLLVKSKDPDFDYILHISKEEPLLRLYLDLREKYTAFFQSNLPIYEGFAVWLERILLCELDQETIWNEREREIKGTGYEEVYQRFKQFEDENGVLSLIYKVGFPKRFDKESIVKVVNEHLDTNRLSFLVLYGSKRDYGDIDLLAVSKNDVENNRVYTEDLDIIQVTEKEFIKRIGFFDIALTQPVLTGKVIIGDERTFERLRNDLSEQKFSENTANFLRKKAFEVYNDAKYYYNIGVYEATRKLLEIDDVNFVKNVFKKEVDLISGQFLYSLHNLSYVWSYGLSIDLYNKGCKALTLDQILDTTDNKVLKEILDYSKAIKSDNELPKSIKTKGLLDKTKEYVLNLL